MFGPFALQWRAPSPNPPSGGPLPAGITRTYIRTASGPLELLSAVPSSSNIDSSKPPLFFAHGGFGCAAVWLSYLTFFSERGYPCYAVSYRGHGNSWYPGFWQMYFTTRNSIADDLVAAVKEVERRETERRKAAETVRVVLVSHSAGGALSQYVLSRGLITVQGFCLFAGVPGFGSWSCYNFWLLSAPLNFIYRLFHSRYLLVTTKQVHDAFFTSHTPTSVVQQLERLLSPYESMCWPVQALSPFVTGLDVLRSITGWRPRRAISAKDSSKPGIAPRLLVVAAQHDVLCTPPVLRDAATRYRNAFYHGVKAGMLPGVSQSQTRSDSSEPKSEWDGVAFTLVKGVGHHLQNHQAGEWERGAEAVLAWVEKL